jgi:DNA adenine methylase
MKPLLSYYGGKQRLAKRIKTLIDSMPHMVFTEPFCGGASVLFSKEKSTATDSSHYREAINDKNDLISNFYRVSKLNRLELEDLIQATLYSQADHKRATQLCKSGDGSSVELAWAVFVNCNMSFANKLNSGWGTGVKGRNLAYTWKNRKDRLQEQLNRLADVHVASEDAIRFIDRWDSPVSLHYCDPPYVGTNCGHYGGYTQADLDQLIEKLNSCMGSFILSGYSAGDIPSNWNCVEIAVSCTATGKSKTNQDRSVEQAHHYLTKEIADKSRDYGDRSRIEKLWYLDRSKPNVSTTPLLKLLKC